MASSAWAVPADARRALVAAVLGLALVVGAILGDATPAMAQPVDDAQELAERYAPIVMVRTQAAPCDEDGEPFAPMSVDHILDNPQIALRQLGNGDPTVMRGPGADDLAELGEGFYLDFPGDALSPGCLYEQDHDRFTAGHPSVVYAHIVHDDEHPDVLVLQYWSFWYYNDWNNKHESDWEFVQLVFPAGSAAEALSTEPVSVGYAQHEGGERADWHDAKLQREGTHPVVYTSQRSHASYFAPAVYIGRSASEGFGCDHTEAPSTRIEPDVVVLPDRVDDPDHPLAWIGFEGRWGERHGGPNNGPTGPNTKPQWSDPVTWQEELRASSFVVPGDDSGAARVIDAFCGIVGWGSVQYIKFVASPARVLLALAVLGAGMVFLARRTSWRVVPATPLRQRRRAGEILRLAAAQLRRRPGMFAAAAVFAVPVWVLAALVGVVVPRVPVMGAFVQGADSADAGSRLVISSIIASTALALPFTFVSALVTEMIDDSRGARATIGSAWAAVRQRAGALITALVVAVVSIVLVSLTVIAVPVAVWLLVRWQFFSQVAMVERGGARAALAGSARLVRRRWWHTALVAGVTLVIVSAFGITVGLFLLIFFTGLPLWALSAIVATCNIVAMPYGALVMTYLYGDAVSATSTPVEHDPDEEHAGVPA